MGGTRFGLGYVSDEVEIEVKVFNCRRKAKAMIKNSVEIEGERNK
jgi:hypothetical protein